MPTASHSLFRKQLPSKPASLMQLKQYLNAKMLLGLSKSRPTAERMLASIHEIPSQDVCAYITGLNNYIYIL